MPQKIRISLSKGQKKPQQAPPQIVVSAASARRRGGRPRRGARSGGPVAVPPSVPGGHYGHALQHPFAQEAEGCRVPDPYAQATQTYKVQSLLTMTSDATGQFDFVCLPRLDFSYLSTRGTLSGGQFVNTPTNSPITVSGPQQDSATGGALASLCTSYRIVAMGVRLRSNATFSTATGRLICARLPAPKDLPAWSVPAGTTAQQMLDACNIPSSGGAVSTNLLSLPKSQTYTLSQLSVDSGVEFTFHPVSPSALDFLDGTRTTIESSSGTALNYQEGYYQADGHQMLVVFASGLPASTIALTAEVIYHIEMIPKVQASLIPSGAMPNVAAPGVAAAAHQAASRLPMGMTIKDKTDAVLAMGHNLAAASAAASKIQGAARGYLSKLRTGVGRFEKVERAVGMLVPLA